MEADWWARGIALFAAIIGATSFGWQVYTWFQDRRDRALQFRIFPEVIFLAEDPTALHLELVNPNLLPLRVIQIALEHPDHSVRRTVTESIFDAGQELLKTINPLERVTGYIDILEIESWGFDASKPIVVIVRTPVKEFHSSPVSLMDPESGPHLEGVTPESFRATLRGFTEFKRKKRDRS